MIVHDAVHVLLQEFTEDASEGDWPIVPRIRQFVGLWDRIIDSFHWSGILPIRIERLNNLVIDVNDCVYIIYRSYCVSVLERGESGKDARKEREE